MASNLDLVNVRSLEALEELRESTLALNKTIFAEAPSITYKAEDGSPVNGWRLHNIGVTGAQYFFMHKGQVFKRHQHTDAVEFLIVWHGLLRVECDNYDSIGELKNNEIGAGEIVRFPAGSSHRVIAQEDTWAYGITVPADQGYPK